jgi:putative membrane protein
MREPNILKGMAAGALGGLVASFAMNEFQKVWATAEEKLTDCRRRKGQKDNQYQGEEGEDATMKTVDRIAQAVQGQHLTKAGKKKAGPAVHYAFGTIMGAIYGAPAEVAPATKSLAGIPFGTVLFAGADEIALPVLGLSKSPTEYPLSKHLYGLVSHAVYGVTIEAVRRAVRG